MTNHLLDLVDWPNAIAGAILAGLLGLIGFSMRVLLQFLAARRSVVGYGIGTWYSAEYDPKGNVPHERRTTFLKVEVGASVFGRVRVRSCQQLDTQRKQHETGWVLNGRIEQGALLGEWKTTVKNTRRFGVAMLRFLDNGRAVGYWVGVRADEPPLYGYWVMSRDLDDLKRILDAAVPPGRFRTIDVARLVANADRGSSGAKI